MKCHTDQQPTINQKRFHHLIDTICRAAGIDHPESLYENAVFRVDDVLFSLMHMNVLDPEHVVILADFGPPPPRQRDRVLRQLLETNLHAYHDQEGPSFCINPDNGHVMLMNRLPLTGISAHSTLSLMASLVDLVKTWRSSFFLEEPAMAASMSRMVH